MAFLRHVGPDGRTACVYIAYGLVTGRFRRKLFPIRPREVLAEIGEALRFRLSHEDITRYNAVQRLLYAGIILVIVVQVLSGWAVWKPMQLSELSALFFGFQGSRLVHFIGMAAIVGFIVVHVALALIVPKTIGAMITGGPRVDPTPNGPPTRRPPKPRIDRRTHVCPQPLTVAIPAQGGNRSKRSREQQGASRRASTAAGSCAARSAWGRSPC